jgi:TPR repeat protein
MSVRALCAGVLVLSLAASIVGFAAEREPAGRDSATDACVRAAEAGSRSAQKSLGSLLLEGGAVRPIRLLRRAGSIEPPHRAAQWYFEAAPHAPVAAWRLGQMFESGEGVPYDSAEALRLYTQAAEAGFAPAQNSLGNLYMAGIGVAQDYSTAIGWYVIAAENGDGDALLNLAGMYFHGLGVEQDYAESLALASAAAALHVRDAEAFM